MPANIFPVLSRFRLVGVRCAEEMVDEVEDVVDLMVDERDALEVADEEKAGLFGCQARPSQRRSCHCPKPTVQGTLPPSF